MDNLVTCCNKNRTEKSDVILGDVQINEKFNYNLFSLTKMLLKGYTLKSNRYSLTMWNQTRMIVLDILVHTGNGALYCTRFIRNLGELETANPVVQGEEGSLKVAKKILKVNIKHAHECFGHLNKDATCKIATQLGVKLYSTIFLTCKACAIRKAKQHNIPREMLKFS